MSKRDEYILKLKDLKGGINYLIAFIFLSFILIVLRLLYLQVVKHNYFSELAKKNRIRLIKILPTRGTIKTSDGITYAKNIPAFSLYYTRNLRTNTREIKKLSFLLNIDYEKLLKEIKKHPPYSSFLLESDVPRNKIFWIMFYKEKFNNIDIEVTARRYYPGDAYVYADIVGYVSLASAYDIRKNPLIVPGEEVGRKGVERKYNSVLLGKFGYKEFEVNAMGIRIKMLSITPPKNGKNITLTVNAKLQNYLYKLLGNHSGAIIVMKTNGAILGMVSKPTYDPNLFLKKLTRTQWNRLLKNKTMNLFDIATQATFPPGSIIKPFVAIGALRSGIITPRTILFCPPFIKIGKNIYKDWNPAGFGRINLYRALASSSDVFFYQVGKKLGIKRLDLYLSQFGFGKSPGLFSYTAKGILPSPEEKYKLYGKKWYIGDTIITTIGQGYFLVSPLQVAVAYQMLANSGIAYKPFLLKGEKPSILYIFQTPYYGVVKRALWEVVNKPYGTAFDCKIKGLNICGKTGTSQIVTSKAFKKLKKEYKEGKISKKTLLKYTPDAWFASFAPMNKPKVVVVVFLRHGRSSWYAASLARKVYIELIKLHILMDHITQLKDR